MEILTKIKRLSLFILFPLLLLSSCKEAVAPDYNNNNDPKSELFQGQSPSNFKIYVLSQNVIKLEWQNNSNYTNGYVIERSINNDSNFTNIGLVDRNVTSFIDSAALENNLNAYYYRLRMKNTITENTANIITGHYINKIKLAENVDGFLVSPNGEYIAVYRKESGGKGRVKVYNVSNGSVAFNFAYGADFLVIALSNNNIAIVIYGELEIFRIKDGALIAETSISNPFNNETFVAFNHEGNTIALYDDYEPQTLYVWNLEDSLSLKVEKEGYAEYWNLKFSENDKYLVAIALDINKYTVYDTNMYEKIFSAGINGHYVIPHVVNQDIFFYVSNSFCFYDLNQKTIVSSFNDLDYVIDEFGSRDRVNINNAGSILSVFRTAKNDSINSKIIIDFWSLTSDYKIFKRFKTIDLGNEIPTDNAFSSHNDFIVRTNSGNLYLWKYY